MTRTRPERSATSQWCCSRRASGLTGVSALLTASTYSGSLDPRVLFQRGIARANSNGREPGSGRIWPSPWIIAVNSHADRTRRTVPDERRLHSRPKTVGVVDESARDLFLVDENLDPPILTPTAR